MPYFDNNATTPLDPSAQKVLFDAYANNWGNPSSPYRSSAQLRASIEKCREALSTHLGVEPDHLIFTSGATEANNSIFSNLSGKFDQSARVLLSPFEHPSVTEAANYWFSGRVDLLTAQSDGTICLEELDKHLSSSRTPCLVSVMAASNESGVIQPWREVARLCRDHNIPYHCDSTQLPGKEDLNDLSLSTFHVASAHKFGGPKGVGWLVGGGATSLLVGGQQEKGRRGGTVNYPAIVSAFSAWESQVQVSIDISKLSTLRDHFEEQMQNLFPNIKFIGQNSPRLWNTSLMIMPCFENLSWVSKLDKLGFQVSTGSACSTTNIGTSPIADALGLSLSDARHLIRVSSSQSHTTEDWHGLFNAFQRSAEELENESSNSAVISL